MEQVLRNSDNSAILVRGLKTAAIITSVPTTRGTSTVILSQDSRKMAFWGDNNDWPQKVIADIRKDTELGPLLKKRARLLASGGLIWGTPDFNDQGEEILKPLPPEMNAKIRTWLKRSNIKRYLMEGALDLETFYNAFPEMVLSLDRKEIVQLCIQAAETCRYEKQNSRGIIENCYINANFPDQDENHKNTKKVPVIDPYFDPAETLRQTTTGWNFIYSISYPTPGSTYYQVPTWNGLRESGWLAISQAIPKFKLNLLENQLSIKYHIEISDLYWPSKYKNWDSLTEPERKKIVDAELKIFSDLMTGVEKSGSSLVTAMITDKNSGKEYSLWKVTVIDDKIKAGQYLEEGKDASINKAMALGLHPALIGSVPNTGMGGAGSNIREAYNLHTFLTLPDQQVLLEPLSIVAAYNGWGEDIEFRFSNNLMTTLNTGTETKPLTN